MMESSEIFEKLRLELRRGGLPLAVLAQLRQEHYGLLQSEWRYEDNRKKRFYRISALGEEVLALLIVEWHNLNASVDRILEES